MAYTSPTAVDLMLRYPAFTGVDTDRIDYWITDAARFVDDSWPEQHYGPAILAYAAHKLSETGALPDAVPAGVTSFKSGTFSVTVAEGMAGLTGFDATIYGREFVALRRSLFGGPRLIGCAWA